MHDATPGNSKFSGNASDVVEKFGYKFMINEPKEVAEGQATLIGDIYYECPEGEVIVAYPNINFNITSRN
jgi:hypothetical protein